MRQSGTCAHIHGIKAHFPEKLIHGEQPPGNGIYLNGNPQLLEILHLALHDFFLRQAELRDAVGKYAASYMQRLKNRHLVTKLCQVTGTGQPGRAGADDSHLLGILCKLDRLDFLVLCQLIISYKAFQPADAYRLTLDAHDTVLLALVFLRADAAADCRQGVGLLDNPDGLVEVTFLDFADKGRNIHLHRAALAAFWHLASQAAVGLRHSSFLIVAQGYLLKIAGTNLRVLLRHLVLCHN